RFSRDWSSDVCSSDLPATVIDSGRVAIRLRDLFEEMKLRSFAKTSGSKGIHLYVPLNTKVTFEQTKQFAQATAMLLEKRHPDKRSEERRVGKERRRGR